MSQPFCLTIKFRKRLYNFINRKGIDMKKIIALLLMLALCVSMMVACGNDEAGANETKNNEPKAEEPKAEEPKAEEPKVEEPKVEEPKVEENNEYIAAEEPVNGFFEAFKQLDGEKMASYMDDPSYAEDAMASLAQLSDFDAFSNLMAETMGDVSAFENEIRAFYDALIAKVTSNISGTIEGNVKVGDDYHVNVAITFPNFENGDPLGFMEDAISEEAVMEIFMSLYETGEINEDMLEEELAAKLLPAVFEVFTKSVNDMEITTVTKEGIFVVSNIDGKWLISMEKTDKANEE